MTNKPQTCYVELDIRSNTQPDFMMTKIPKGDKSFLNGYPLHVTKLPDRYIFTKEELEAYVSEKVKEASMLEFDRGVLFGAKELQQQSKQLNQLPATTKA